MPENILHDPKAKEAPAKALRRIEFTADAQYEQGGPKQGHIFRKGEVHDFEEDFANRWVRRGVAKYLDDAEEFKPLPEGVAEQSRREAKSAKKVETDAEAKRQEGAAKKAEAEAAEKARVEAEEKAATDAKAEADRRVAEKAAKK